MSGLVWKRDKTKRALERLITANPDRLVMPSKYQSYVPQPLPDYVKYDDVTLPVIAWLLRKHPVPDIEDRIREVKSNGGYHDVTKFERRPEK